MEVALARELHRAAALEVLARVREGHALHEPRVTAAVGERDEPRRAVLELLGHELHEVGRRLEVAVAGDDLVLAAPWCGPPDRRRSSSRVSEEQVTDFVAESVHQLPVLGVGGRAVGHAWELSADDHRERSVWKNSSTRPAATISPARRGPPSISTTLPARCAATAARSTRPPVPDPQLGDAIGRRPDVLGQHERRPAGREELGVAATRRAWSTTT